MNNGGGWALMMVLGGRGTQEPPGIPIPYHRTPCQVTSVLARVSVTVLETQSLPNRDPPRQGFLHSLPPGWLWTSALTLLGTERPDWGQKKGSPIIVGQPCPLFTCPPTTVAWDPGVPRLWRDLGRSSLPCVEASEAKPGEIREKHQASGFCLSFCS